MKSKNQQTEEASRASHLLKKTITGCENSCANLAWRTLEYLIKEGVVPPLDPGPVSMSTHVNLHYRFDVVSRQLTGLDDSNPNLRINSTVVEKGVKEQTGTGYAWAWYWPTTQRKLPTQLCCCHEGCRRASWSSHKSKCFAKLQFLLFLSSFNHKPNSGQLKVSWSKPFIYLFF